MGPSTHIPWRFRLIPTDSDRVHEMQTPIWEIQTERAKGDRTYWRRQTLIRIYIYVSVFKFVNYSWPCTNAKHVQNVQSICEACEEQSLWGKLRLHLLEMLETWLASALHVFRFFRFFRHVVPVPATGSGRRGSASPVRPSFVVFCIKSRIIQSLPSNLGEHAPTALKSEASLSSTTSSWGRNLHYSGPNSITGMNQGMRW